MRQGMIGVLAAVAVAACLGQAGAASAASWTQATTPVGGLDRMNGIACSSASACTSVGDSIPLGEGPQLGVAERWDGTAWSIESVPVPSGTVNDALDGVACPSATDCFAVGFSVGGSGLLPLAARWHATERGAAWSLQELPLPLGGSQFTLNAISCTSTTACTAVGFYVAEFVTHTLVYRWDGSAWTRQTSVDPTGNNQLYGVSCSSASACTAVGYDIGEAESALLVEAWDGTSWSVQPAPLPEGASGGALYGVSCTSSTACTAVGTSNNRTLAERWDGRSWTIQSTPNAEFQNILYGVSCTTATACIAVGQGSGSAEALAISWNGGAWSLMTVPQTNINDIFRGVACTSATACVATGSDETEEALTHTLQESLSGTTWSIVAAPFGPSDRMHAVSCASASECVAAGETSPMGSSASGRLVERWNGSRWEARGLGRPSGALSARLLGVSCASEGTCVTVGDAIDAASGTRSAVASIAGEPREWRELAVPEPEGATAATLRAVSCTSGSACTAVGSFVSGGRTQTLAERWNGSSWSLQSTPNPAESTSTQLNAVSCSGSTACIAAGSTVTREGRTVPLAERWNGSEWTLQSIPAPTEGSAVLKGVSCSAASACTAVGSLVGASVTATHALALRWNGSSWSVQRTPAEAGDSFAGVSCSSATSCVAVGHGSGPSQALAERWDGTAWTVQETVSPGEASQLEGVTCRSEVACVAAGAYQTSHAIRTLVETSE